MKPTLLILAAGIGSRYGGLKQIDPMGPNGETVLDYSIYDALRSGFGAVTFVIRKDIEQAFREALGSRYEKLVDVRYAFQELSDLPDGFRVPEGREKPWGTAHAVLSASEVVHEPFGVINADDFYGVDAYRVLAKFLGNGKTEDATPEYAVVGYPLRNTLSEHGSVARAICTYDEQHDMQSVEELTKIEKEGDRAKNTEPDGSVRPLTGDELVSMNMWGFTPSYFTQARGKFASFLEQHGEEPKSEFYIPTSVNRLIEEGVARVKVLRTESEWFGVTYREDKPKVMASIRALVDAGTYPEKLWD